MSANRHNRRVNFQARAIGTLEAEARAVEWFDTKTAGLTLLVTPAGARTWYLMYRANGVRRRVKLGTWPALALVKARTLARSMRVRIETTGADPAHERAAARTALTIGELADLYMEQYAKVRKATWKDDEYRIYRHIVPGWGSRAVRSITRADVHTLIDPIAAAFPVQANRVQQILSKVFNFAIDRDLAAVNPCHRMPTRTRERARETVLTDEQLRALWAELEARPSLGSDAIAFRLLTGQRGGEVHKMCWSHIERLASGWVWTIPAKDTKNGRAHRVPLPRAVEPILARRQDARTVEAADRVFPGLYHVHQDLKAARSIHAGAYRWHDLRRTVASRLAGLGIGEDVIGRLLNHTRKGITATVYNQYAYDAERLAALEAWTAELGRIVKAPAAAAVGGGVLAFRRGAVL